MSRGKKIRKSRISPLKLEILQALKEGRYGTWSAVAEDIGKKQQSVGRSALSLIKEGLIERRNGGIFLTDKGYNYFIDESSRMRDMLVVLQRRVENITDTIAGIDE